MLEFRRGRRANDLLDNVAPWVIAEEADEIDEEEAMEDDVGVPEDVLADHLRALLARIHDPVE